MSETPEISVPAPTDPGAETVPPRKRGRKGELRETIQILKLARRTGMTYAQLRVKLRAAGIKGAKSGDSLRALDKINAAEALAALSLASMPADAPKAAKPSLADAAAAASRTAIPPMAEKSGTGSEDDPIPEAVLSGDYDSTIQKDAFPMPTAPSITLTASGVFVLDGFVYVPKNKDDKKLKDSYSRGWRRVTTSETLWRLYPDGSWKHYFGPLGVVYHDLVLCRLPLNVWQRRKSANASANTERLDKTHESYKANIEEAQRELRRKIGPGGSRAIGHVEIDPEEAAERAARSSGEAPAPSRVFVGKAAGNPAR